MTTAQAASPQPQTDMAMARRAMIDSQLRPSGVNQDRIIAAMGRVAREDFLPDNQHAAAYIDRAAPLGNGRFLAAPLFHGQMLQEADPTTDDRVLVIAGGCGYLSALLKDMGEEVDTVDAAALADAAGVYDLILIDGAVEKLPDSLSELLADDGRVVCGVVDRGITRLATGRKAAGQIALYPLAEMGIPVLPEFVAPKVWSF